MRIVVEIPPDLVDDIRSAVQRGHYQSPDEFLEQALRTQLQLETSDQESLMSFSEAVASSEDRGTETPSTDDSTSGTQRVATSSGGVEDLSRREFDVRTVAPPAPDRIDTGPLWGQYNRILPMKLAVRRLAIELGHASTDGIAYQQFRDKTAAVAREYGLRLEEIDEDTGRGRGEKFSAAFPTGEKVERSLERFKTHFIGQIDSTGSLTGSLPNLKFVDIDPATREFGITDAGLDFSWIENPILDEALTSEVPLSEAERRFYLDHVSAELPAEYHAMEVVAEAIEEEINRPDSLSDRIGELSEEWTDAQASTIRSGLVGRMVELGLVDRTRVGARGVGYLLTDDGERELL